MGFYSNPAVAGGTGQSTLTPSTQTASFTAVANYLYSVSASSAAVTVTLPSSTVSQSITVKKGDATIYAIIISGTINGVSNASVTLYKQNQLKQFYADNGGGWIVAGGDIDLNTVNGMVAGVTVPPVGGYGTPIGIIGFGYGSQPSGRLYFHPFWVGPAGWTADAFRTRISQARVGGTGIRKFAVYPDGGGYPDTTPATMLASVSIDDTTGTSSNGGDFAFAAGAVYLTPGLYWCGSLNYLSAAASTTANVITITNVSYALPNDANNAPDAIVRSIGIDSQTDLPASKLSQSSFVSFKDNSAPYLMLRRSA